MIVTMQINNSRQEIAGVSIFLLGLVTRTPEGTGNYDGKFFSLKDQGMPRMDRKT